MGLTATWELWCVASGNLLGETTDLHVAGRWWGETMRDKTLTLVPDIDCEGDCCAAGACRFGLKGGPSCGAPDEVV